jgi:hypothetical protein
VSNTSWQSYTGEQTMSYLSQILAIAAPMFLSAPLRAAHGARVGRGRGADPASGEPDGRAAAPARLESRRGKSGAQNETVEHGQDGMVIFHRTSWARDDPEVRRASRSVTRSCSTRTSCWRCADCLDSAPWDERSRF